MNIAFFVDGYYPTVTGVITVISQLKTEMEKMGHHVIIITIESRKKKDRAEKEKDVYRVPTIASPLPKWDGVFIGFPNTRKIAKILKENNIEITHAHTEFPMGCSAYKVAKYMGIPCVATTHTMWEDYYKYYFVGGKIIPVKMVRNWVKGFFKHFNALINVSKKAYDYYKLPYILPDKPCEIIPNAIDESKFKGVSFSQEQKNAILEKLKVKPGEKIILYAGRVVEEKRVDELYASLCNVVGKRDDVKVVFVGTGLREDGLRKWVVRDKMEDRIIFTGFVSWPEISLYYSICDIFVTASLSEMHSMTVLEALTMGKPIVCRKDTSFTDTVFHGEDGFLADTDEELESYILKLLDDDALRQRMGINAIEISKRFALEKQVEQHIKFYQKVIEEYKSKKIAKN